MFWILRRTGAVNFFNSLNSNCSTSKGNNNTRNGDKYVKRPPRKAYGRLSVDSDDCASMTQRTIDDPFDDVDNFEMIASSRSKSTQGGKNTNNNNNNNNQLGRTANELCQHINDNEHVNSGRNTASSSSNSCRLEDCQGNAINGDNCNMDDAGLCSDIENNGGAVNKTKLKEVNQNTINRLHAMTMSDDDDYDEALTCNVCDRAFACHRQLASHQQKKRHFCCGGCDSLFPSLMLLEHHKEEFEHWSDDEISRRICCRRNRGDDYFTDTDSFTSEAESEDLERLL